MREAFEITVGRIETLAVDAVVNAANRELIPGSGVDGALRVAAGPDLTRHTETLPSIEIGDAVLTPGFGLSARYIIHTVAPVWVMPGGQGEKVAGLARCYGSVIALAEKHKVKSLAFPCLGTGNFGWPRGFACGIAIAACENALEQAPGIERVIFCCFTEDDAEIYRAALG
jgi:O-acetyl-ADP-ribose deacetylase (regulator of RNase III)